MNKHKFFIYAGPPKTASTWLFSILDKHLEVEMPLLKEVRYFEILDRVGNVSLLNRLFGRHLILKRERRRFFSEFKKLLKREPESWYYFRISFKYFFSNWSDKWYKKLFSQNKVSGDISPLYCSLSEESIKKVKAFNPRTKIIIGLRNPIDKKWSGIKMRLVRMQGKKSIEEVDKQTLANALNRSNPNFDDYTLLIDKWRKYFDEQQILVYYYEELKEDPKKLYNKICRFLEIQPIKIEGIEKVINKGKTDKVSMEYEKIMVKANYKYIEKFAKSYPNKYSLAWVEKYKDYDKNNE